MRIAFVAYLGSVHTRRWVAFFAERGHDVHVVTCGGVDGTLGVGYSVHDLGRTRFGKLGYLLKILRARRVIRSLGADIVHAHHATSYGLLAIASGVRPLVVTAHGNDVLVSPRNPAMRPLVRRVIRAASLITVPSTQMRDAAAELISPEKRDIVVFQYGVEVRRLAELGERRRAEIERMVPEERRVERVLRIVSARALESIYRIDVLLDALRLLKDARVAFVADVLGDGPDRPALERRMREHGLAGCVAFRGHQPVEEVERSIAASDVYVSVSESDGASIALLEALALGAIPVVSDIPANREWVEDGTGGVLVEIAAAPVADGIRRAALLDREAVAARNRAIVAERADRDTNLASCELLIDALVGVSYDAEPVSDDDASAA